VRDATRAEGADAVVRDAAHTEVEQVAAHAEGARVVTQIAAEWLGKEIGKFVSIFSC
jgi:hypothetical protein